MSRLNAGAYEFVPGQGFRPPQQGQSPPGAPSGQSQPPPGGYQHPNPYTAQYQQSAGPYPPQQQQPFGQGYYPAPAQGYQGQYMGYTPYYGQFPQHHQQSRGPFPSQAPFQPQNYPQTPDASVPPNPNRLPERAPADAPAPVTVSINIGGAKKIAAESSKDAKATPSKVESSATSSAPPSGTTTPTKAPKMQASVPKSAPVAKEKTTERKETAGGKDKEFNFTMDRAKNDADAIIKEQAAVADSETLKELYGGEEEVVDTNEKMHLNVVFTGHVDAGKSTLGGQILVLTGMVDKRTLEKYERDAKEAGRESWYLSWALDSTPQEREKGKTVEVGRAYFETDKKRYTILDAPGHKTFVPSMISGAAQADVSVLVISARKGEFETGFEKGGQTREHITLVRTAGVNKIIVVINKMDDPTVEWDKARFEEIKDKLSPFARATGYNPKTDLVYIPVSAYTGVNIKERADKQIMPWYTGPSLLEYLDTMVNPNRKLQGPVMMPISEKYKDMGTIVVGKLESGRLRKGDSLLMMPNHVTVEVAAIYNELEEEVPSAFSGDNVRIRLRGVDDEDISPGFVLTSVGKPVHAVKQFVAQLAILEHKNIICAGYSAVMHVHTLAEEISLLELLHYLDKKTGKRSKKPPQFAKKGMQVIARVETTAPICLETYKDYPQLGRFTLRDEGKTVAMGKVLKLIEAGTTAVPTTTATTATTAAETSESTDRMSKSLPDKLWTQLQRMTEISRVKTCSGLSFLNDALQGSNYPGCTDNKPLDQAINQALPYSTSLESSLNRGDTVEIQGPSGSGKTELLYFLATKTLLPREIFLQSFHGSLQGPQRLVLGGRNKSVVVCDCDGRWNVTRLMTIVLRILREKLVETFPDADPEMAGMLEELKTVALDALQHLHIFQPTSSASLAATLIRMPQYHFTKMPHEEICMLMVDGGLSSFYWQDRWRAEVVGRRTHEGIQVSPATEVVRALVSFIKSHKPITFITTRALFPLSNTSYFFKQHIPPPFPAPFETSQDGKTNARTSALDIIHHITLYNPNRSPVSDHEELLTEDGENPESHINREFLRVQGVMRTPPRDVPETMVNHFSFLLTEAGITAEAIEVIEGSTPIDPSAPEY